MIAEKTFRHFGRHPWAFFWVDIKMALATILGFVSAFIGLGLLLTFVIIAVRETRHHIWTWILLILGVLFLLLAAILFYYDHRHHHLRMVNVNPVVGEVGEVQGSPFSQVPVGYNPFLDPEDQHMRYGRR